MPKPRYLTKSRFKLACECPTKLFYTAKHDIYANTKLDNSFLKALADGGYQIGELAKHYFPKGCDITSLDYDESLTQTNALMQRESVTIYEAAIKHDSLFIRVDVLKKQGNQIDLIEVKAKSFDTNNPDVFLNKKNGSLSKKWRAYLYDVAFQKYVVSQAFPDCQVSAYLMLVDKATRCPTDGLNQKFRIEKNSSGRWNVHVSDNLNENDLSEKLLCQIPVDCYCDMIFNNEDAAVTDPLSFDERISLYAKQYASDIKIESPLSSACHECEFKTTEPTNLRSGFKECWSKQLSWSDEDFLNPTILSLWDNRNKGKQLSDGIYRLTDLHKDDISVKSDGDAGLSRSQRQWMQIEKARDNDNDVFLDADALRQEMTSWVFPLHFIDFETAMPALPFNKGRHPYEGIAFQFSHHIAYEDGRVEHKGQYLNTKTGVFPNYDFIRALKSELSGDNGSIFRYATHENTYLNMIHHQLQEDTTDIKDRDELCSFIETITHKKEKNRILRRGERDMIDMLVLVKRYYFDPEAGGSNSIKQVLPSILNRSDYLKEKYAQAIYGAENGLVSLNFKNWAWVTYNNERVADPYSLLPKIFSDVTKHDMDLLTQEDELKDGGAAMTAYARMQFEEMSDYERKQIQNALLMYCELDTLAMVMLYEGWREMV